MANQSHHGLCRPYSFRSEHDIRNYNWWVIDSSSLVLNWIDNKYSHIIRSSVSASSRNQPVSIVWRWLQGICRVVGCSDRKIGIDRTVFDQMVVQLKTITNDFILFRVYEAERNKAAALVEIDDAKVIYRLLKVWKTAWLTFYDRPLSFRTCRTSFELLLLLSRVLSKTFLRRHKAAVKRTNYRWSSEMLWGRI